MRVMKDSYVSLTTYKKDGTPVATPVWFVIDDNRDLYIRTLSDAWKVKRIRNNPHVTLTPCTVRGKLIPGATTIEGTARILLETDTGHAKDLMARKYLSVRISNLFRPNRPGTTIAVTPS